MNKAAQAYFQTKVSTTDQGQLLLLLYDGALRFLAQAREKIEAKDYAAKGILISKVIDILSELTNTLNLEKGGTLAENLNNLYFLCTTRLLQANLKMDVDQLESVVSILSGLRSAYAEIIETPEAKKASAQISARLNVDASLTQRAAVSVQNHAAPTSFGRMQARNAYGAQRPAAPAGAQMPPSGIPAAGMQQAPQQAAQAVQSEQTRQSAPQMAQPATAQPTGQAPQVAQAATPSVAQETLQTSAQPTPSAQNRQSGQSGQGMHTAQEAQSARAIPFAHGAQAPASAPVAAPSMASPAQPSPSSPVGQQAAQQVQPTQQAVQHSQAQRPATPANATNVASPAPVASTAPATPATPTTQKPAPAPTPKAPLAPKQGFGVSGFAYTKAFGK